jgi:hypothetical protein
MKGNYRDEGNTSGKRRERYDMKGKAKGHDEMRYAEE